MQALLSQPGVSPAPQGGIAVEPTVWPTLAAWLRTAPGHYYDMLSCLTAIDLGHGQLQVVYTLYSIPQHQWLAVYITIDKDQEIPSVAKVWAAAEWHEREAYDLVGVKFIDHPDMRRILLPADWQGHPLQRDYTVQESYHGLHTAYEKG